MENGSSRIQNNIMVRNDARSLPTSSRVACLHHMVRHVLSKTQFFISNLRLGMLGTLNDNIERLDIEKGK